MAVKKEDGKFDLAGMLKSGIFSGIVSYVKGLMGKFQDFVIYTEEKVIQIFYASTLFIAGLVFLSISVVLLMSEYLKLSQGWSFLIIGLILIMAAMMIKNKALKDIQKRR